MKSEEEIRELISQKKGFIKANIREKSFAETTWNYAVIRTLKWVLGED